jgi:hypothetical protein
MQENLTEFEKNKSSPEVTGFMKLFKDIDTISSSIMQVGTLLHSAGPLIAPLLEHGIKLL